MNKEETEKLYKSLRRKGYSVLEALDEIHNREIKRIANEN